MRVGDLLARITVVVQDEVTGYDVFVVKNRTTTRADVATFAVEQLIIGPTATEQATGLAGLFGDGEHVEFTSVSSCSGKDLRFPLLHAEPQYSSVVALSC